MKSFRPNKLLASHISVLRPASESEQSKICSVALTRDGRKNGAQSPTPSQLIGLAKRLYMARSRRQNFLGSDLFGEPAWDMLLALYHADATGQRMTVSNLCDASQGPHTTALRWLDRLEQLDLVRRERNAFDGRVSFIELQPAGRSALSRYLLDTWSGLFA